VIVNGIRVNLYSTHLDADSSARRATQMRELTASADHYPESESWPAITTRAPSWRRSRFD